MFRLSDASIYATFRWTITSLRVAHYMKPRALIIGAGIAGMATAIALEQKGWHPVLVERAPGRRKGGYFIGLRDEGRDAARSLGILDALDRHRAGRFRFWDIRKDGRRRPIADLTRETDAPLTLMRGDIEDALWKQIEGRLDIRFETTPLSVTNRQDRVEVVMQSGNNERVHDHFDLVIGADGVRSTLRTLVFGPDRQFLRPLGTALCVFPLAHPLPGWSPHDGLMIADNGRTLTVFPLEDRPSTALFSFRTKAGDDVRREQPHAALSRRFSDLNAGGFVKFALDALGQSEECLFDTVQTVRMKNWSKGRVALVGDSAWCLTLYSGMGASAALMGGVALADCLDTHPHDLTRALEAFEARMRPFVSRHQRFLALRAQLFVPSGPFALRLRRILWQLMRLTRRPGRSLRRR